MRSGSKTKSSASPSLLRRYVRTWTCVNQEIGYVWMLARGRENWLRRCQCRPVCVQYFVSLIVCIGTVRISPHCENSGADGPDRERTCRQKETNACNGRAYFGEKWYQSSGERLSALPYDYCVGMGSSGRENKLNRNGICSSSYVRRLSNVCFCYVRSEAHER